jgi:hypothetical protein
MKTLRIGERYRKNPLSLQPGGYEVTVVWQDGTEYVYDNVKMPKKYVSHIAKKTSKHGQMTEVRVDNTLVWKREDPSSTNQEWRNF